MRGDEIIAHSILTDKFQRVNLSVQDVAIPNANTVVTVSKYLHPKIKVKMENDIPQIDITLKLSAQLIKSGSETDYLNSSNQKKLIQNIKYRLTEILSSYLAKTSREFKTDIAGFGRYVKANYVTWDEFEEIDWLNKYPKSKFKLNIEVELDSAQIVTHTLKPNSTSKTPGESGE